MMRSVTALLLLLLLTLGSARAARPTAGPPTPLEGYWKGPLRVPGGQLEVVFRLVGLSDGGYYATLDVPLRKLSRLPVATTLRGDSVVLEVEDFATRFTGRLQRDGQQLVGTWQQQGYATAMTLHLAASPAAPAAGKVRLTPPYREEEVSYLNPDAGLRFGAMLTIPAGKPPFPTVVLVADNAGYDREGTIGDYPLLRMLGDYLTRRGIAVLRFDSRGSGQTGGAPATVEQTVSDVEAALSYLRTRPEVELTRLGVIGHGLGANVALLAAARPLPPGFVVGLAAHGQPASKLLIEQQVNLMRSMGAETAQVEAAAKQQRMLVEIVQNVTDVEQSRAIIANVLLQASGGADTVSARAGAVALTTKRYRDYLRFDPLAGLDQVKCAVLLLTGAADLNAAPESNLMLLTKALRQNPAVSSRKLPGVNYLLQEAPATWPLVNGVPSPRFSPTALEAIRAWIVERGTK